ncbi:hypothetical protein BC936DRAFT_136542 [Jimgerdemannia flammicorona]|uniref:Uncharacterized protein n=1 Tax=Jimgerdemannia flammicorona TaxID=994334 RepID=A0A433CZA2_9FUNG|nr:hypothetical protein BC936DRAFT_136542 [Jimgerdemannia flammicorona]
MPPCCYNVHGYCHITQFNACIQIFISSVLLTVVLYFHSWVANFSDIFTGCLHEEIPLILKALGGVLKDKEYLIKFNLSNNAFGPAGTEPIVDILTHTHSLQILCLNNNGLGISGDTMIANALLSNAEKAHADNHISSLCTIICSHNFLEDSFS